MGLFDFLKGPGPVDPDAAGRLDALLASLRRGTVPDGMRTRLEDAAAGRTPWTATLTAAELRIARHHGLRPIAAVSATCWLHYGWSWTLGHAEGWQTALRRLGAEARACGANAVLDVKMRTIAMEAGDSMDYTLLGTAVRIEGLPPSEHPVIATVPALEFVSLLAADVVPTGIAIGAHYEWLQDWRGNAANPQVWFNAEATQLSGLWERVRRRAHADLRESARGQGNGVLAHLHFSQMFEAERSENLKEYLARHIVVATTVDMRPRASVPQEIGAVVDLRDGATALNRPRPHHQSYSTNEQDGAI